MRRRRTGTKRRGPRMVLGKVKRRRLHYLPSVRIIVLFSVFLELFFYFLI